MGKDGPPVDGRKYNENNKDIQIGRVTAKKTLADPSKFNKKITF